MRIIDVHSPRSMITRIQYIQAQSCPACGHPLHWFEGKPIHIRNQGRCVPVELMCPVCVRPPVDAVLIPCSGPNPEETLHSELQLLADVTLFTKAEAVPKVRGIQLI